MACKDSSLSYVSLTTNCEYESANDSTKDLIKCNDCKTFLYGTQCQGVSLSTDCSSRSKRPSDMSQIDCYACQNRLYQTKIVESDLDNDMAQMGNYQDTVNRYGNEITKTAYITVGIIGLLLASYYIR